MAKQELKKELTLTVSADTLKQKIQDKLVALQQDLKLPGFRPGQVPLKVVENRYKANVLPEALEEAAQQALRAELTKQGLKPALAPKMEMKDYVEGKDTTFIATVEVLPEVPAVDVAKLQLKKLTADVDEKDIEQTVQKLQLSRRTTQPSDEKRKTKEHDIIVIDFVGTIDGQEFKGGKGKDYYLDLGSNTFIPGFEEQLTGQDVGAVVDVNVTFPENYHSKEVAGKKALFKTTIKELRQAILPELNDDFAKDFGADTMDALRDMIRTEMAKEYEMVSKNHMKRQALDILDKAYPFDVPEGMVKMEFDAIWSDIENAKAKGQLDEDDKGKTDEQLKDEYMQIARRRVRLGLLLAEVAKAQKITLTPEEVNQAVMREIRRYPGQEKQMLDFFKKHPEMIDSVKGPLLESKVMDWMIENAKTTEEKVSAQQLYDYDPDKETK